jgi:hypothetical protein
MRNDQGAGPNSINRIDYLTPISSRIIHLIHINRQSRDSFYEDCSPTVPNGRVCPIHSERLFCNEPVRTALMRYYLMHSSEANPAMSLRSVLTGGHSNIVREIISIAT